MTGIGSALELIGQVADMVCRRTECRPCDDHRDCVNTATEIMATLKPAAVALVGIDPPNDHADVWDEIARERVRAHRKHGPNSMELADPLAERRHRILGEEYGEVLKEFNDAEVEGRPIDVAALRKELVQVAAMAGAWADTLSGLL